MRNEAAATATVGQHYTGGKIPTDVPATAINARLLEAKKLRTCTLERTEQLCISECDPLAFKIVNVVRVEGLLEVPVLGDRRLRLERPDQLVSLRQVLALRTLARYA